MLNDPKAVSLLDLLRNETYNRCPDEQFFGTLNHNPGLGAPGSCLRVHEQRDAPDKPEMRTLIRYKQWYKQDCRTKRVRGICILGTPDVKRLNEGPELFANKFHAGLCPEAYDCL